MAKGYLPTRGRSFLMSTRSRSYGHKVYRYFVVYAYISKESAQEITTNMGYDALNQLDSMEKIKKLEEKIRIEKDYHRVRIVNFHMFGIEYM